MNEKVQKEIARLEKINVEARAHIIDMRANHANERAVRNAVQGLRFRETAIARLREVA